MTIKFIWTVLSLYYFHNEIGDSFFFLVESYTCTRETKLNEFIIFFSHLLQVLIFCLVFLVLHYMYKIMSFSSKLELVAFRQLKWLDFHSVRHLLISSETHYEIISQIEQVQSASKHWMIAKLSLFFFYNKFLYKPN